MTVIHPAIVCAAKCAFVEGCRIFLFDEELAELQLEEEHIVYIPKAPIERLRERYKIVRESAKRQVYKEMCASVLRHEVVYGFVVFAKI